jgi:glycosyltransferase involved in cell wall biosynthesis
MVRVIIVADGDPADVRTNSGVARGVLEALRARPDVEVVGLVDSRMSRWQRVVSAVTTIDVDRVRWRNQYRKGRFSMWARSRNRDRALRHMPASDLVLHVRNTYHPVRGRAYAAFVDNTSARSQLEWPAWRLRPSIAAWRRTAETRFFDAAAIVYTAAEYVADDVVELYAIDRAKVCATGGGANFRIADDLGTDAVRTPGKRVLFVGIDFVRKGGPALVDAFAEVVRRHPEATLTVVGPTSEEVSRFVSPAPPWLDPRGFVRDRRALAELYASADVFCLPAVFEPYGLVLQEAMAHGVPCVVTQVGALPEIVGDGGLTVRPGDRDQLVTALDALLRDPAAAHEAGSHGRRRLSSMSWAAVVDRMIEHLAGTAAQQGSSPLGRPR